MVEGPYFVAAEEVVGINEVAEAHSNVWVDVAVSKTGIMTTIEGLEGDVVGDSDGRTMTSRSATGTRLSISSRTGRC